MLRRLSPLLLVSFFAVAAHGAVLVVPPDDAMIRAADAIVVGTVVGATPQFDVDGLIVTHLEVEVELALKGAGLDRGARITIVEQGGEVGSQFRMVSEYPNFWVGNRALIFLDRGEDGALATWGASLGKFDFVRDAANRVLAVRWAMENDDVLWTPEGNPHEELLRDADGFISHILGFAHERKGTGHRDADYFLPHLEREELDFTPLLPTADQTQYPPSAYTHGNFRWRVFDQGGFVTFRVSGSQPGYDSTGAAQRAMAAWNDDPGSNVDYRYGGTTTALFAFDGQNTIVYNSATGVPAGALAYAQWMGGSPHSYKGESFSSISEGDVVVRQNVNVSQTVFDEAVTHELGHTLGFRHSDQGTPSSTQAVMKAVLSGAFGATLGPWDVDAVRTVYESTSTETPPGVPTGVVATAVSTSRINVTWSATPSASSYEVERATVIGSWTRIATPSTNSFADTSVSAGRTYLYRIRAVNDGGRSNPSALDHATTILFTDDPLVPRVTVIKAVHLTQLRTAVNAMRAAANLSPATWTDPSPAGVRIKAVHITQLRSALTPALSAFGKSWSFNNGTISPGEPVRAIDFQELRNLTK